MKVLLNSFCIFLSLSLFAQQKGVTPLSERSPLDKTQNSPLETSETYAVVVGISDYQDEGIPDLRFADKDAEAFAGFLMSPAGGSLDEDHLKLLVNDQATSGEVGSAMFWLMEVAQENDKVIIYFSGHGDVEQIMIGQPGFLLCWDAPTKVYMAGGTVQLGMLQSVISTLSINNKAKVVVITDACRSGKLSGSAIGGAQATTANLTQQYANEIKILSCQPEEYSIEGEQWGGGRGAFSYHLLDGLYGMADGNADGSVDLKELDRYLEDKVSEEVAPESQNPMTIGSRTEKLTEVVPAMLEQLREGRMSQLQLFTKTDTRGIEDEVLAAVDSSVVEMYQAFQDALEEKHFLSPAAACADYYYEKLSQEPQLERIHSSMRRNYAAALQDDAQQLLNLMLRGGETLKVLKGSVEEYMEYPEYLEKAANLLGEDNYMYPVLQARKYFLMSYLTMDNQINKEYLLQALKWQPDMPHSYAFLVYAYYDNLDSAQYYYNKAREMVPSWTYPYIILGNYYGWIGKFDESEMAFLQGLKIDSNSIMLKHGLATVYKLQKKYDKAESLFLETLSSISPDVCYPCARSTLIDLFRETGQIKKAENQYWELIRFDTTIANSYNGLGWLYLTTNQFEKAENQFLKAMKVDSLYIHAPANLGLLYSKMGRYEEAEKMFKKGLELAPDNLDILVSYAVYYSLQNKADKAYEYLEEALNRGYINNMHIEIPDEPDFILLREETEQWDALMKKYFPDQFRD